MLSRTLKNTLLWMAIGLAASSVACSPGPREPELIPLEIIFGNPERTSPCISPDGTRMSYLAPVDNVLNIWVGTIGQGDMQPVTQDTLRGIRYYFWAADNRHIMYIQDKGGDENWRLYATDLETATTRDLTPFENVQAHVIEISKHHPNELLISMNRENPEVRDVYRLNLTSGELTRVAKNPGNIIGWMTDADFRVRANLTSTDDGGYDLLIRDTEMSEWKRVVSWGPDDALLSGPISFTRDGGSIYLIDSRDANAGRLVRLELATGKLDVLAEDPQYDVTDVMINPDTYVIEAVTFTKARNEVVVLDPAIRADIEAIQSIHPGDFFVTSRDDADDTWMVGFTTDDGPVPYYSYDRVSRKAEFLFDHQPELKDYTLASMEPIEFEARDGLLIHGYVTFPPGHPRADLPMVLKVHGGPWSRDRWGWDAEAQWLANRGYACLEVNYRGSTGYGKEFVNAGDREWAGKMHDDLIDGVEWAVDQGYADRDKVAIFGASWGGYAALVGATFTPDVFCCAVDLVGPSNLVTMMESFPPYMSTVREIFYRRVGHPVEDREFLESRSPLFKVDQIKIPLLIAQGANDPRVKQAESDQIVAALKAKNVQYNYLLFLDEGHGLARPENRLEFYAAVEEFLADHLGGRSEKAEGR